MTITDPTTDWQAADELAAKLGAHTRALVAAGDPEAVGRLGA